MNKVKMTLLAGMVLTTALIIVAIFVGVAGVSSYSCHKRAAMQGLECDWGLFQGCMVKTSNGNWMDYDRLRYMK